MMIRDGYHAAKHGVLERARSTNDSKTSYEGGGRQNEPRATRPTELQPSPLPRPLFDASVEEQKQQKAASEIKMDSRLRPLGLARDPLHDPAAY